MKVNLQGVKHYYNHKCVLDIDNLEINEKSLIGIIGPNGAGKSTLINAVAGMLKPSRGEIRYNNGQYKPDIKKSATLVFQKPYLLRTTVFNNIAYPLAIRGVSKEEVNERVNDIIKEMGIEKIKDQRAWTLSGGEAQKVALARAIVFKPELLLLDEPTANIDPASVIEIEETIRKFHRNSNSTVMIITHNIKQAERLCNEVMFMNEGQVLEYGEKERVFKNPNREETTRFISGEIVI